MKKHPMLRKKQAGFSINELGIYLLIVAVLSSLGFAGYNYYVQSEMGRKAGEAVAQSMRKMKLRQANDYSTVTINSLISSSVFDNLPVFTVDRTGNTIRHKVGDGGSLSVAPTDSNTTASITVPGLPVFACENFVMELGSIAHTIVVGSTTVKAATDAAPNLDLVNCTFGGVTTIIAKVK